VAADETLQQAICRASMEKVNLSIKEITRFLTYKDSLDLIRTFYFVAQVHDPEDIQLKDDASYAWVDLLESFGYPIQEMTREVLDIYRRLK
jgi:8-oxo-dGTP pyrophosphatase MutT (NUDIX family)